MLNPALCLLCALCAVPQPAVPSPVQYAWHEQERLMFVCIDPATWQGREYDNHSTPLSDINPEKLDADQWCRAAKLWGAKQILFVAKHTGGFCWWRTDTTAYGIKDTPWRGGGGDVLAELADACRRHGLNLGIYVYPGDDTWGAPMGSGGRTGDPAKQEAYNAVYRQQLTEVLTRYGSMTEVWFDGSCVIDVADILAEHAKDAVIFQGPQATIRWPGTESGKLPYPAWNSLKSADLKSGGATAVHGDPDGDAWAPLEADTTLYDHFWFWAAKNEAHRKSLAELMDIYYKSAGRGGVLLLNSTPNTDGLIPEGDLKLYEAFGKEIERRFANPLAEAADRTGMTVELELPQPALVNHAVIMEDYRQGERIRGYVVEGLVNGEWARLCDGSSVGRKKIDVFRPVLVEKARLRVIVAPAEPIIRHFAVYYVDGVFGGSLTSGRETSASAFHSNPYAADRATDNDPDTRWGTPDGTTDCWLEVDLGAAIRFGRMTAAELADRVRAFSLEYRDNADSPWKTAHTGTTLGGNYQADFTPVTARHVRLNITEASGPPTIWEFNLHAADALWEECAAWDGTVQPDAPLTLTVDLSKHIPRPGQYEVRLQRADGAVPEVTRMELLYEGSTATPGLLSDLGGGAFNVNRAAQVTKETSSVLVLELASGCGRGAVLVRPRL